MDKPLQERTPQPTYIYHCNKYSADKACEHCEGIIRCTPWCITVNANIRYAYSIVLDSRKLTYEDTLILHALSASWSDVPCKGTCDRPRMPLPAGP